VGGGPLVVVVATRLDTLPQPPTLPLVKDPREVRATTMGLREKLLPASRWSALRDRCAAHDVTRRQRQHPVVGSQREPGGQIVER
jgi:hypothetical protein